MRCADADPRYSEALNHRPVCSHPSAFCSGQNEFPAAFIILRRRNRGALQPFAYIFNRPCHLPDEMIFIHDDCSVWKGFVQVRCRGFISRRRTLPSGVLSWECSANNQPDGSGSDLGECRDRRFFRINQNALIFTGRSVPLNSSMESACGSWSGGG